MARILKMLRERKREKQIGATAVEFAIVILVFITIVFGIIEFGLLMYNQHIVTNAGREGARAGIVFRSDRLDEENIKEVVDNYGEQYIVTFGNRDWAVNVDPEEGCAGSGQPLEVNVTYRYDFLLFPWGRDISSTTTMLCE